MIDLFILSSFMYLDYLFTYIGIQLNFIEEANLLLVPLFQYPFLMGTIIRFTIIFIVLLPIWYLKQKQYKYYNYVLILAYFVNISIFFLHLNWIIKL